MTLARLLATALVICSLPGFAQDRQSGDLRPSPRLCGVHSSTACISQSSLPAESFLGSRHAATPSEPWKIIPNRAADLGSGHSLLDTAHLDHYRLDQMKGDPRFRSLEQDALNLEEDASNAGPTCYAIRSYVVARDSKDSDSTHMVKYSTCQPAARYQLKTTEMRSVTQDR